ncbi:alpha/beta hydrolase fold domain-containing protein [[Mycobacterium] wendilense]|uniref:Alpha/beta hydrolase fold domain-containing protein n=1 Tax=[Mycobacterium] wendilense TaxID=3064284 RepID=A0ABN9PA87_9MYCO|nr:alpha/beta hydrolase fold domain-containing protein [Mycolicibacterium sp. MU0050]CAJ1587647.1 alpha/beta hydrolase fold domain-containing protein [Mycolicibacterium sp. MU0050]
MPLLSARAANVRFGALVVAVGVGTALTTGLGCGIAAADNGSGDGDSGASSRSADTDSSSTQGSGAAAADDRSDQTRAPRRGPASRGESDVQRPRLGAKLREVRREVGGARTVDRVDERLRASVRKALDDAAGRIKELAPPPRSGWSPHRPEDVAQPGGDADAAPAERPRPQWKRGSFKSRLGTGLFEGTDQDAQPAPLSSLEVRGSAPRQLRSPDVAQPRQPEVSEISESVTAGLRSSPLQSVINLPVQRITEAVVAAPSESVPARSAPLLTRVFDAVFRSSASGPVPAAPASTPLGWAALAFARREFDPAQRVPSLTGIAPAAQVFESAQTVTAPVAIAPGIVVSPDLYPHTAVTGKPSFFDEITNVGLSIMRSISEVVGFNISYELSALMSSDKPPWFTTLGLDVDQSEYTFTDETGDETTWKVWEIASQNPSDEYVVAVHGGALVNQPNMIQWLDYAAMARETGATVVVPIFPMVTPEEGGNAQTIVGPMADFIAGYVAEHDAENVSVYADSSGGMIAMLAVQKLVRDCQLAGDCATALPSRMVLISPALGGADFMNDPNTQLVNDPVSMPVEPGEGPDWQGDLPDDSPLWDPTNGSAAGLPPTAMYLGTRDMLTPTALLFAQRMLDEGSEVQVVLGMGQIHNWAMGGLPANSQAPLYRQDIYRQLGLLEGAQTT